MTLGKNERGSVSGFAAVLFASRAYIVFLFSVLLCAVVVCELAIPWLLQQVIDTALGTSEDKLGRLNVFGVLMIFVIVVLYFVHMGYLRLETQILHAGMYRLRQRLYRHVIEQPLNYFHRKKAGMLIHRVVSDSNEYEVNIREFLSDFPFEMLTIVGVFTLMYLTNWKLAMVVTVFVVVAAYVSQRIGEPLPGLAKKMQRLGSQISAKLQEVFSGIRTVKSFGRGALEVEYLDQLNEKLKSAKVHGGRVHAYLKPIFDFVEMLGVIFIVWFGARLMIDGSLTAGGLVAFIAYMELLAEPMGKAGDYFEKWYRLNAISHRLWKFLHDSKAAPAQQKDLRLDELRKTYPVLFDHLAYVYPGNDKPALKMIDFSVAAGEVVALSGSNGSGKSTLMDLLLGLIEPSSGHIYVDGFDNNRIDPVQWMSQVGVLSQDVFLFHCSVAENIGYGDPTADRGRIEVAAGEAGLGELLAKLPNGIDTVVGDRGSKLSGGEKQKIALARLFLKQPKIVILDEPTSALDRRARGEFAGLLESLTRGKTTFIISHHEEIISMANRLVTLEGGKLVEDVPVEAPKPVHQAQILAFIPDKSQRKNGLKRHLVSTTEHEIVLHDEYESPNEAPAPAVNNEIQRSLSNDDKYKLALECLHGDLQDRDESKAVFLLQQAAESGYAAAQYLLGKMYQQGIRRGAPDYARAMRYYEAAAANDHLLSKTALGFLYEYGLGVEADYRQAARWYEAAAALNEATALNNLALLTLDGKGVDADIDRAFAYFLRAAELGFGKAMYNLGALYESDEYVPRNMLLAKLWYQRAADSGHLKARHRLFALRGMPAGDTAS